VLDSTGPAQPSGDWLCTEASRLQIRDVRAAAVGRALIRRRHRRNAINIARQIRFSAAIGVGSRSLADDAACRLAAGRVEPRWTVRCTLSSSWSATNDGHLASQRNAHPIRLH